MRFAFASVLALGLLTTTAASDEPLKTAPLGIEQVAEHPAMSGLTMSPDGKHIAALVASAKYKWPVVTIWEADNLAKAPIGIPSTDKRPLAVSFLGNEHAIIFLDQPFTPSGFKTRTFEAVVTDLAAKKFTRPFEVKSLGSEKQYGINFSVFLDGSVEKPNEYLIERGNPQIGTTEILKLDVTTMNVERAARAADDEGFVLADIRDGQLMVKEKLRATGDGWQVVREVRNRTTGSWEEHPQLGYPIKQRAAINPLGFFDPDPNKLFVSTNRNSNFQQIQVYDIVSRTWETEPAFASPDADISDASALIDNDAKKVVGVGSYTVEGPARREIFVDDAWSAVQRGIEAKFPGKNVSFIDTSRKLQRAIVEVSGPTQPPVYFLLLNGRELKLLGKSKAAIDTATLGETKYVTYKARDGMTIPGLLTLPKGYDKTRHGRIPLIVHPHGGPWARDYIDWDSSGWTQFLSTRGYAVLQPQYRGSDGWGMALWKAGDMEWGQKMQDDKDDGAAWLVAEGIADPQRMAIFGYSYGGFAAIAASVRPNSPYKCAIAGAGVANLQRLGNLWGANRIQRESQGWTVKGMDPQENVAKANIPIMLYHGDRDTTADTRHSRDFFSAMKSAGKDVEYYEIKDMWHQLPWWPEWHRETLGYIENYLAGPKCFGAK